MSAEKCPGHLTWSAFGAAYPDTVCSTALEWAEGDEPASPTLCDADDDLIPKDIPCPFHRWADFTEYQFGGGYVVPFCVVDFARLPDGIEIHYHDGERLAFTADCPEHGEQTVAIRDMSLVDGFDEGTFEEWKIEVIP